MTLGNAAPTRTAVLAFSTRQDGDVARSQPANRAAFCRSLGINPASVVAAEQVHGARVARVGRTHRGEVIAGVDALVTDEPGVHLMLVFADCVPVLLHDPARGAVAAVHAGWRGTAAGIAIEAVQALTEQFGSDPRDVHAAFGPAIGRCCYEVSEEVAAAVQSTVPGTKVLADGPRGRPHLDLPATNRAQLLAAGLRPEHVTWRVSCTSCQVDRYFSHRAEAGRAGRMAALIGLREEDRR